MIRLEKDGVVDGIILEDGDEVALGAKLLLTKFTRKTNGEYKCKAFSAEQFFHPSNPFRSEICSHKNYCSRIKGNGPAAVLGSKSESFVQTKQRNSDGIIDLLANSTDKMKWLECKGMKGKLPMPLLNLEQYHNAYRYMLHSPVLRYSKESDLAEMVSVVSLEDTSDRAIWMEYVRSELQLGDVGADHEILTSIFKCDVLPLTRRAIKTHRLDAPPFSKLAFMACPVSIHPTLALVNWLRAHNLDARLRDDCQYIIGTVELCRRVDNPISTTPLQPLVGKHNAFTSIKSQEAGNEYNK